MRVHISSHTFTALFALQMMTSNHLFTVHSVKAIKTESYFLV